MYGYVHFQSVGGAGGRPFEISGVAQGKVVEKIGAWAGPWQIKAIRVWLTDAPPVTVGEPSGAYREIAFEPGERVKRVSLWSNDAGTRLGWIELTTERGRIFSHGMTEQRRQQEIPIDIGSGILVGVTGRFGADIDALGFVFLPPIQRAVLTEVRYPTLEFDTPGIHIESLGSVLDDNGSSMTRTWLISGDREVMETFSWSVARGIAAHVDVTIEAGVPEIVRVGRVVGWAVGATVVHAPHASRKRTLRWRISGALEPGETIALEAISRRGKQLVPYSGVMRIELITGEIISYPMIGMYSGTSYTAVEIMDQGDATATRASIAPGAAEAGACALYTIRAGDTLWAIAERLLGDGAEWVRILEANPGIDPDALQVGRQLVIPDVPPEGLHTSRV